MTVWWLVTQYITRTLLVSLFTQMCGENWGSLVNGLFEEFHRTGGQK